jgi:hypothetical protein
VTRFWLGQTARYARPGRSGSKSPESPLRRCSPASCRRASPVPMHPRIQRIPAWAWALATAITLVVIYAVSITWCGPWDPWETHYGEVARNIVRRRDPLDLWWKPGYGPSGGEERYFWSKHALPFWCIALSFWVFGVGTSPDPGEMVHGALPELALRLPSLLAGLATIAFVGFVVWRLVSPRAGIVCALVLGTMPQFAIVTRQAHLEGPGPWIRWSSTAACRREAKCCRARGTRLPLGGRIARPDQPRPGSSSCRHARGRPESTDPWSSPRPPRSQQHIGLPSRSAPLHFGRLDSQLSRFIRTAIVVGLRPLQSDDHFRGRAPLLGLGFLRATVVRPPSEPPNPTLPAMVTRSACDESTACCWAPRCSGSS